MILSYGGKFNKIFIFLNIFISQMERKKPSKKLISEILRNRSEFISAACKGLFELSIPEISEYSAVVPRKDYGLQGLYPYLDVDEALFLAVESWYVREKLNHRSLMLSQARGPVQEIKKLIEHGKIRLWSDPDALMISRMPHDLIKIYAQTNPYLGQNLEKRLRLAAPESLFQISRRLGEMTMKYEFEGIAEMNASADRRIRHIDEKEMYVMRYQPRFPKKGRKAQIDSNYLNETVRILTLFPNVYLTELDPQLKLF